jgi:hypothetical protein
MMGESTALTEELKVFADNKQKLLKRWPGLYILIKGDEILGPYPNAEAAYDDGLERFGLQPFLVKQVLEEEPVGYVPMFSLAPRPDAGL